MIIALSAPMRAREDACSGRKSSAALLGLARRSPLLLGALLFIIASLRLYNAGGRVPTDTLHGDLIDAPSVGPGVAQITTTRRNRRICVYDRRTNIVAESRDGVSAQGLGQALLEVIGCGDIE